MRPARFPPRTSAQSPGMILAFAVASALTAGLAATTACAIVPAAPQERAAPAKDEPAAAPPAAPIGAGEINRAIESAVKYLMGRQNADGGYGPSYNPQLKGDSDVGLTAFALYALARSPRAYKEHDGPYISKAVDFLLSKQQPDGSFHDPRDPSLQNYKTSVAVLALAALDRVKYARAIERAADFIKSQQFSEGRGFNRDRHLSYGGIGYGSDPGRADASNSNFAIEALHEARITGADSVWERAVVFLARCQNAKEVDPLLEEAGVGTSGDGGARYGPHFTRGPVETLDDGTQVFSSYGSMTYAMIKSFLHAQVKRDDPRVQEAFRWISRNFTVEENPGMATPKEPLSGQQGLYYYYHTMAKALSVYGEPIITDAKGIRHDWARELAARLVRLQKPQGFWVNPADRWMEGIPELDTSYALVALTICKEEIDKQAAAKSGK